jgi:YcxB-like protein
VNYKFSFELTDELYLQASRLNFWYAIKSAKAFKIWAIGISVYALMALAVLYFFDGDYGFSDVLEISIIAALAWLAITFCFAAISYFLLPRQSRKLLAQQKILQGIHCYEVSEDQIIFSNYQGNSRLAYDMAHKWAENSTVFLVYHSDRTFQILAKNAIPPAAIDLVRTKLIAAGRPGQTL